MTKGLTIEQYELVKADDLNWVVLEHRLKAKEPKIIGYWPRLDQGLLRIYELLLKDEFDQVVSLGDILALVSEARGQVLKAAQAVPEQTYEQKDTLGSEDSRGLFQCPYVATCRCSLEEPCLGCETFHDAKGGADEATSQ